MTLAGNASQTRLIVASGSPRREELVERLGTPFDMLPSGAPEEVFEGLGPAAMAERLALRKARSVAGRLGASPRGSRLVLGADTTIDLDGESLGKPSDPEDARGMLRRLRGRAHSVVSGVALVDPASGESESAAVSTVVWMRPFSEEELDEYVATGEPMDKAGSYAIQGLGGDLVERWQGCWNNVMGLPLCEVARLGRELLGRPLGPGGICPQPYGSRCFYQ